MDNKDIYNLNKSLYKNFSREILSATQYINNLYPDFDGDKKVFENIEKHNIKGYIVTSNSDIFFDESLNNIKYARMLDEKKVFTLKQIKKFQIILQSSQTLQKNFM